MYNQELKLRYQNEKESYTTIAPYYFSSLFKKTEPFEEALGKDVCNFSTYEIINMYKTLSIMSLDTISSMNSHLSMYTQWCIQENLVNDYQNHFLEIGREMMSTFVNKLAMNKKVVSREQVLNWCAELPNPSDSFCLLALFEGLKGTGYQDLALAKIEDFNKNTNAFTTQSGREIFISDELINYAKLSNETLEYQSISGAMSHNVDLIENGRIIKDYCNTRAAETIQILRRRIQTKLARIFSFLGLADWMNGNDIRMSGVVDMIKVRSRQLRISCVSYVYGIGMKEVYEQYGYKLVPSAFLIKFGEYLNTSTLG